MANFVTVERNGATITVGPTTPRAKLTQTILATRLADSLATKAAELGTPLNVVDRSITDFIKLSSWILESTNLDFVPLTRVDDTDTIWEKWEVWQDSQLDILFRKVAITVGQLDNPNPPSRSPQKPDADAPKA